MTTGYSLSPRSPSLPTITTRDKAHQLRQEILIRASQLEHKPRPVARINDFPVSPDSRSATNIREDERKAALKQRRQEALHEQMADKQRRLEELAVQRKQEKAHFALQSQLLDLEEEQARAQHQAKITAYRQSLDLQLNLKKVSKHQESQASGKSVPSHLNQLAFELPELQNPQPFTYHRPKVVPTDPFTFHTPRREDWPKKVADYGKMSLQNSPFREPVINKHSGVTYRDTRDLLR